MIKELKEIRASMNGIGSGAYDYEERQHFLNCLEEAVSIRDTALTTLDRLISRLESGEMVEEVASRILLEYRNLGVVDRDREVLYDMAQDDIAELSAKAAIAAILKGEEGR